MEDVKVHYETTDEDKRRYAYEKAIEAYWKHVDRYHTWMNYYSLFNGALFVGFCTLLTATTKIEQRSNIFSLSNDYTCYAILICIVGLIASICWKCSLSGHQAWERNWMNIIEHYETKLVYSLLITEKNEIVGNPIHDNKLTDKDRFKAFSTHKITNIFICIIIISWITSLIILIIENIHCHCVCNYVCNYFKYIIYSILVILLVIFLIYNIISYKKLYSDVKGKTWKSKEDDDKEVKNSK